MKKLLILLLFIILSLPTSALINWESISENSLSGAKSLTEDLNGNLYVTTDGGLFMSTDEGDTWQKVDLGQYTNAACSQILFHKSGIIFILSEAGILEANGFNDTWTKSGFEAWKIIENGKGELYKHYEKDGIYKSTDIGKSWVYLGLANEHINKFNVISDSIIVATTFGGLYISHDDGSNWKFEQLIGTDYYQPLVQQLQTDGDGNIFVAGENSNFYSKDNGITWQQFYMPVGAYSLVMKGTTYVAYGENIYVSRNLGQDWAQIDNPIGIIRDCFIDDDGNIFFNDLRKYSKDDVWSSDSTSTSTEFAGKIIVRKGNIFCVSYSQFFMSNNLGNSWKSTINLEENAKASIFYDDIRDQLYLLSDRFLYRSSNMGESWDTVSTSMYRGYWQSFNFNIEQVVVGYISSDIYISYNYGYDWEWEFLDNTSEPGLQLSALYIDDNGDVWWAIHYKLYKYNASDKSTKLIKEFDEQIFMIKQNPLGGLIFGGRNKIYATHDFNTFTTLPYNFPSSVTDIKFISHTEFIAQCSKGLFRGNLKGEPIEFLGIDQDFTEVTSFDVDSEGNIIVGTRSSGIYKGKITPPLENKENEIDYNFSLYQNYPNPFNPGTVIGYSLPERGFVELKIYDSLGREIAQLVKEVQTPGIHSIEFQNNNLAAGVYFYQLTFLGNTQTKKMILLR